FERRWRIVDRERDCERKGGSGFAERNVLPRRLVNRTCRRCSDRQYIRSAALCRVVALRESGPAASRKKRRDRTEPHDVCAGRPCYRGEAAEDRRGRYRSHRCEIEK